jgi:serine/threonine-protein kinase HipA
VSSLNVWMNGDLVGDWRSLRSGTPVFRYAQSWAESPHARALSLSLPLTVDREVRGPEVDYFFDNLLPDSPDIRSRIRQRFKLRSTRAFDLLEAIGRDCVGAVQLLPLDQEPAGWDRVHTQPLSDSDVERLLQSVTAPPPLGRRNDDIDDIDEDFRISIAGAQEKTALLSMGGAWFRPRGATPTTHILKLPLGIIGNFRGDFSDSVENEWLCAQLLREWGFPVADTNIATFGGQKALVVTRFDRRWLGTDENAVRVSGFIPAQNAWIARLPQEDFCQATGRPPIQRYESDGGPSIDDILGILAGSENAERDRATFVLAQLAFWLLAATDGHGKNFSIHHRAGGTFALTPLYDVLSAWPVIGRGTTQLQIHDAKLAMALHGRNQHYRIVEIQARHWQSLAQRAGGTGLWARMRTFVESVETALQRIENALPGTFPGRVISKIANGIRRQAASFLRAAATC